VSQPRPPDPETREEWQEAVDVAVGARAIADCKMYGLLEGGPEVDVDRCDEIIERGRQRGVLPSRTVVELAAEIIAAVNLEATSQ
jgi:hypothetical protein